MTPTDILATTVKADGHSAGFKDARDGTAHANPHPSGSTEWRAWQDGYEEGYVDGVETIRDHLRNILARIHRDGGHYTEAHGIDKATRDADILVANLTGKCEEMRHALLEARNALTKNNRSGALRAIPSDLH
jgi:hypothetical protein